MNLLRLEVMVRIGMSSLELVVRNIRLKKRVQPRRACRIIRLQRQNVIIMENVRKYVRSAVMAIDVRGQQSGLLTMREQKLQSIISQNGPGGH